MNSLELMHILALEKERDLIQNAIDVLRWVSARAANKSVGAPNTTPTKPKSTGRKWTKAQKIAQSKRIKAYHAKRAK